MEILRYAAFSSDPAGGNPAGVVLDATGATAAQMQAAATELGYPETAFLTPKGGADFDVRYFSPKDEVPFCGHATIAAGVAYAQRHGTTTLRLTTNVGLVELAASAAGTEPTATLTTVSPHIEDLATDDLEELLACLRWARDDLDPTLPPHVAFAGGFHPIIAAASRERLAKLDYDFDALTALMTKHTWLTIDLVWRESASVYYARNPFPVGGIVEDPATGAAAAAFGGYLRALELIDVPARLTIHQGNDLGRPAIITVDVPADLSSGISVTGTAVAIVD